MLMLLYRACARAVASFSSFLRNASRFSAIESYDAPARRRAKRKIHGRQGEWRGRWEQAVCSRTSAFDRDVAAKEDAASAKRYLCVVAHGQMFQYGGKNHAVASSPRNRPHRRGVSGRDRQHAPATAVRSKARNFTRSLRYSDDIRYGVTHSTRSNSREPGKQYSSTTVAPT